MPDASIGRAASGAWIAHVDVRRCCALSNISPLAAWPNEVALCGLLIPIVFAVCWEHDMGRARQIGYLLVGWLLGLAGLMGLAFISLSLARGVSG